MKSRNWGSLAAAAIAALAMSAIAASAAQAESIEHTFKSAVDPTNLTAHNEEGSNYRLSLSGGAHTLECKKATYEGTVKGQQNDIITLTPTYSECTSDIAGSVPIHTNHCALVFDSDTTTHGGKGPHAPVDLECSSGSKIEITFEGLGTKLTIGAQTGLHGVKYTSLVNHGPGAKEAITVSTTIEGTEYSCDGVGCFLLENEGEGTDGTVTGNSIVTGYEDKGSHPEDPTATTTPSLTHGAQVDLTIVNGHRFLPSGGHPTSPLAATSSPHPRPSVLPTLEPFPTASAKRRP